MDKIWEPSEKQRESLEWLAAFKSITMPRECHESNPAMFTWFVTNVERVDKDIAHEMTLDFGLSCDFNDPFSVIGCMKYYDEVRKGEPSKRELQFEEAVKYLKKGMDPWSTADQFDLSESELYGLIKKVEAEGHLVEDF